MQNKLIKIIKKNPLFNKVKFFIKRIVKLKILYLISGTTKPISNFYGIERGFPIDRLYIEMFLEENKENIHGHCLELLSNDYTKLYGGTKILKSDILDINIDNKNATIIGDLKNLKKIIPDNVYDCIILTQVLQFIDDFDSALSECQRILKPDGCILITVPTLSRIDCASGVHGDYWRFTKASVNYILQNKFREINIKSFGNAKTGLAFWIGLSQEDITRSTYDYNDENFPILITAKAKK